MDIVTVLQETDISKKISQLQKGKPQYNIDVSGVGLVTNTNTTENICIVKNQLDVKGHDINNTVVRPDKQVQQTLNNQPQTVTLKVNRIALSLQNLIVDRAVAFLFGNEVKVNSDDEKLLEAISGVNKDNKIDSFNRQVARTCFQTTEVAEYWYAAETDSNNKYGFTATKKLKGAVFSPLLGDQLYPFFDDYGDMVGFSRAFKLKDNDGKLISMFETWTNESYFRWKDVNGWQEDSNIKYPPNIKKIPIVYAWQPNVEWYAVQSMIDRLEKLLSNFGDTNDYFASPMLFIKNGELLSISPKDAQGKILEASGDAEARYLAWSQLPEPIKLESEMLLRFIFSITQTPDISFESVKGLGTNISGETLKMLFLDAHLKTMNKLEIFDSYLTRRYNIVKYMLNALNNSIKTDADVECAITPFMLNSDTQTIDNLVAAINGGIMSIETAVEQNPLITDKDEELKRITADSNKSTGLDNQQNNLDANGNPIVTANQLIDNNVSKLAKLKDKAIKDLNSKTKKGKAVKPPVVIK